MATPKASPSIQDQIRAQGDIVRKFKKEKRAQEEVN